MKKPTRTEKLLAVEKNKNEVAQTLLNGHNDFLVKLHALSKNPSTKEAIENHLKIMEMWEKQLYKLYKIA